MSGNEHLGTVPGDWCGCGGMPIELKSPHSASHRTCLNHQSGAAVFSPLLPEAMGENEAP